jgi:hypothetical protein
VLAFGLVLFELDECEVAEAACGQLEEALEVRIQPDVRVGRAVVAGKLGLLGEGGRAANYWAVEGGKNPGAGRH